MSEDKTNVPNPSEPAQPASKKKRRGWWWKIPLLLVILLVLLVLLAPSIASTSPVRGMILGKVNASLPGKLAVEDWSLGWFSGAKLKGIEWTDATGKKIATVNEVDTPVTVMQLARYNLHFGEIVIKGVKADYVVPLGSSAKQAAVPSAASSSGSGAGQWPTFNMPDVTAKLTIQDVNGQVTFVAPNGKTAVLKLDNSTKITADLPGAGAPTTVEALVALTQANAVGTVAVAANVNGLKPGTVDTRTLSGKSTISLKQLDLDQFAAVARAMGNDLAIQGLLGGQLDISSAGGGAAAAKGELSASSVAVTMGHDHMESRSLRIPLDVELTSGSEPRAIVRQLGAVLDQAQVNATADLSMALVKELQNQQAIDQDGKAHVDVQVPQLPVLMNSLRSTFKLQQDVQITSGQFSAAVDMVSGKDGMRITSPIALRDLTGTRGGAKVGPLQPITIDTSAKVTSLKDVMQGVNDVSLKMRSSFMTLDAVAPALAQANAQGSLDLAKLKSDLGSIVDLSTVRGGNVSFNLASRSTGTDSYATDLKVLGSDLAFDLPAQSGSPARRVDSGVLLLTAVSTYDHGKISLQSPLRLEAGARELLQRASGRWVTVFDDGMQLSADGEADLSASPRTATLTALSLSVGRQNPFVQLALPAGQPIKVVLAGKRGITTDGHLKLSADLVGLQQLSAKMADTPTTQPLKRGLFVGDLAFAIAADGSLKAGIQQGSLDVDSPAPKFADKLDITATADVAGDNSSASAVASINGKTVRVDLDGSAGMGMENGTQTVTNIHVNKLDAQTDFAQVSLVKPVVVSDVQALMKALSGGTLPANTQVGGEILVKADIAKAMAFTGKPQPGAATLAGTLTSHQVITLQQGDVVANSDTQIADFQAIQNGKAVVQEPKLSLTAQAHLSPASKTLEVDNLALNSSSGMLDLKGTVRVADLGKENRIEKGDLQFTPDWQKLWPVLYAMLPPANQQKIGEMVITGKDTSTVTLGGSYPSGQPDALKHVIASGQFHLAQIDWKTRGITASGVIPFQLQNSTLKFVNAAGQQTPSPLTVNSGKVSLADAAVDLSGDTPRLNIANNSQLAQGVQLNTVLVASLGQYATIMFMDPTNASGSVDVKVINCTGLALGTAMYDPKDPGKAEFSISLHQLDVASKGADVVFGLMKFTPAKGQDRITGDVNDGRVTIAAGHCLQKMTLQLGDKSFGVDGDLRLADNNYVPLNLTVPGAMISGLAASLGGKGWEKYVPQQMTLTLTGPASSPHLDQKAIVDLIKQGGTQAVVGGLLGGNKGTQPQAAGATTQKSDIENATDILGGLLNKNKSKSKK